MNRLLADLTEEWIRKHDDTPNLILLPKGVYEPNEPFELKYFRNYYRYYYVPKNKTVEYDIIRFETIICEHIERPIILKKA